MRNKSFSLPFRWSGSECDFIDDSNIFIMYSSFVDLSSQEEYVVLYTLYFIIFVNKQAVVFVE